MKVIVHIKDINDNSPKFTTSGRPYVAAIPSSATYGYPVIKLQVSIQKQKDYALVGELSSL